MRYLYLLLIFSLISFQRIKAESPNRPRRNEISTFADVPDGRYKAIVEYYNSATYTKATYQLVVGVRYGNVASIEFGNGGSVHSGANNEGYYYSGGTLYAETDYEGNIVSYTAKVTVTDTNGTRTFKVTIS
jgi:hypothetical protein